MTLKDALDTIVQSTRYDAMKRPAMGGYFFRSAVSTATGTAGDYTLTLRKRANNTSGGTPGTAVDYVYLYDADAPVVKWTAPETKPVLTGEFFEELLGDDWMVGMKDDFELARMGRSGDEW